MEGATPGSDPVSRPALEIADIVRRHGAAWRAAQAGHVSLDQLKVMSAVESCRTAALSRHVGACEGCRHIRVAYNSCRNRHCPKCQGAAARAWLAAREADLLFRAASETMLTIAADPRHLGARIGITAMPHTWSSALTHHPHVHMTVPGGGISLDGTRWVSSRPAFLLPVHVLGKLFRRLFLAGLLALHAAGRLRFYGDRAGLSDTQTFEHHLAPVRAAKWVVYAKPPFGGPEAVLADLSRTTHRVAISNRRLISLDEAGITFRTEDYRRIRHYGLLATGNRKANIARARELLAAPAPPQAPEPASSAERHTPCPCCGARMLVIERSEPGTAPSACQHRRRTSIAAPADRLDASSGHRFASLGWLRRLRGLARPAQSP